MLVSHFASDSALPGLCPGPHCRTSVPRSIPLARPPSRESHPLLNPGYAYGWTHRRIHRGVGGVRPPEIWPGGVRVRVNYPQTPLIKQVLYLYFMMDTAENINVWHSLAWM